MGDKNWFAVYTRYKSEKWVAETLGKKGIEAYTPLRSRTKKYQRKIKTYHYPLINNYTFVHIVENDKRKVLETNHVIGFLKIGGRCIPIPEKEIQTLKRVVGENIEIDILPNTKHVGENVEIVMGSLTGMKGTLVSIKNKKEFIVQLQQLGYTLKIGVEPKCLRVLSQMIVA